MLLLDPAPAGLELRWQTEPACVEAEGLPGRVTSLLGRAPPEARLALAAEPVGEGWRVALELASAGPAVRRTLEGRDCATLTDAVALVVAVQLDPLAVAGASTGDFESSPVVEREPEPRLPPLPRIDPPPSTEAVGEPEASAERRIERSRASGPSATDRPPSRPRPHAVLAAAMMGELGVLPRGAGAFELSGGVGGRRARLELSGLASVGPGGVSERLPAVGGRFGLFTGGVRGCGVPRRDRMALPLCGGVEVGDLRGSGIGLLHPRTVNALWVAAVASARPQWVPTSRLSVGARLDLVAPLRRHRFAIAEAGLVHAVDPVAVRVGLSVELRLP